MEFEVRLGVPVTQVDAAGIAVGDERIDAETVLWCAGVQGVPLARTLDANVQRNGTIAVGADFSVPGHPECFVVGDAAHFIGPDGLPVPGLASVAQEQGRFVGKVIAAHLMVASHPLLPSRSRRANWLPLLGMSVSLKLRVARSPASLHG